MHHALSEQAFGWSAGKDKAALQMAVSLLLCLINAEELRHALPSSFDATDQPTETQHTPDRHSPGCCTGQ